MSNYINPCRIIIQQHYYILAQLSLFLLSKIETQHISMEKRAAAEVGGGGGGGGGGVSSRWNPTKEQISILENLYKQGVRTPSAEQIQEITSRLKGYGHIEGKNVFYWFQNHKARQRQKQKQDSTFAHYFHHFLHFNNNPPSLPPFPSPNVVCSPYYVDQNDVGFYAQCHNNSKLIQSSGVVRRRSKSERRNCNNNGGFGFEGAQNEASAINGNFQTETLSLFPTHPTGDLQVGPPPPPPPPRPSASVSASSGNSADDSSGGCTRNYFEFFL